MRKFIVKTLLLLLPLLILAISTEYLLQQIPNDYSYKKNYLDKYSEKIQILFLGSSHAYYGIDPVYFSQNTFNASHISQSLDFDLAILNKYQNNLDSVKIIVLPISYFTLWSKLGNGAEAWRVKNYALYYGIKTKSMSNSFELLDNNFAINKDRLVNYYIKHKDNITCNYLGWGTNYNSKWKSDLQETGKTAAKRHTRDDIFSEKNAEVFEENLKTLSLFSEFCNQRNIKLIFLTTPTYYTYRENLNTEQLNKTIETINDFINSHSNCYYFNWFEDTDFVAEDFFDADHLSEIGAEKLSRKLSQHVEIEILTDKNASR